jgi:hypothetical protein
MLRDEAIHASRSKAGLLRCARNDSPPTPDGRAILRYVPLLEKYRVLRGAGAGEIQFKQPRQRVFSGFHFLMNSAGDIVKR